MSDYAERKRLLGLKPTALDVGFKDDHGAKGEHVAAYLNERAATTVKPPPLTEDLSKLPNSQTNNGPRKYWASLTPEKKAAILERRRLALSRRMEEQA